MSKTNYEVFQSKDEFIEFYKNNDYFKNREIYINDALKYIKEKGIWCEFNREQALPHNIIISSENYRETIQYKAFNSRQRAVNHEVLKIVNKIDENSIRIYAPEAVTKYALAYRGRFPKYLGSEYTEDSQQKRQLFPIPIEDLHKLSFHGESFDLVIASEVFEHIPFLDKALSELARILSVGGQLIATFPFRAGADESLVKAIIKDGKIDYLLEPEYHGNPVDKNGSLVYEIPGWNILDRAKMAGFSEAKMIWHYSQQSGILARDMVGVFVFISAK